MEHMDGLEVVTCTRCPDLVDSRSHIVNGVSRADAELLLVGEAPGEREDAEGEPFVGRSGEVLTAVLRETGLGRTDVRITNCIRCRPAGNRDPTTQELEHCQGYLETEIEAISPTVIVALGKVPAEHLLGRSVAVTTEAGQIETVDLGGAQRDVLICVHPAASFYDPSQRETLASVIGKAASLTDGGGQASLEEF
jgi:DNA polymerase